MSLYSESALFCAKGPYPEFSKTVAELLPSATWGQILNLLHRYLMKNESDFMPDERDRGKRK